MNNISSIYLITGASGAGKTSLINALSDDGYPTIAESGRIIVENELRLSGKALPWKDGLAFGKKLINHTLDSLKAYSNSNYPTFADRGLVDNLAWYMGLGHEPPQTLLDAIKNKPYTEPIFVLAPWEDIYIQDNVRNKGFDQAIIEYRQIIAALDSLNWKYIQIPQSSITDRVDFIMHYIDK